MTVLLTNHFFFPQPVYSPYSLRINSISFLLCDIDSGMDWGTRRALNWVVAMWSYVVSPPLSW